jgi:hypothetical protein
MAHKKRASPLLLRTGPSFFRLFFVEKETSILR